VSARTYAVLCVLGTMALGFASMTALLVGAFGIVAYQSPDFTVVEMTLGCWPFIVGASSLTALASLAGFSPDDLGSIGHR
jgi:hypothetical protein